MVEREYRLPKPESFNAVAPQVLADPYDFYAALREHAPVYEIPGTGVLIAASYDVVMDALARPEDFSSNLIGVLYTGSNVTAEVLELRQGDQGAVDVLATADPPSHTTHRRLVHPWLTVGRIGALEPELRAVVDERFAHLSLDGSVEWMGAMANLVPVTMVARILGFPDADVPQLQQWAFEGTELLSGVASPERMVELSHSVSDHVTYLFTHLAREKATPTANLMGAIANAVNDGTISDEEAISILVQVVGAGAESTTGLIGSAAHRLALDPALAQRLRAAPHEIPVFVEETVRLETPFRGHYRVATRETELGGVHVAAGTRILLSWAASNRDETAFDRAHELDLDRPHPKQHVGFGWGLHFCVGAPLARLEAQVVIETLLARTSRMGVDPARPAEYVPSIFVRRFDECWLQLVGRTEP